MRRGLALGSNPARSQIWSAVWLLTYYFSNGGVLGMQHLGGWNILVGFGLAVVGLGLATRWR